MNPKIESALSVALTISALVVASTVVYRQVIAQPSATGTAGYPTKVADSESLFAGGQWIGPQSARVRFVEFGDFQCPFCKSFHSDIKKVVEEFDGQVALVYRHFPLAMLHRHARTAARAADCGAAQRSFSAMADVLYAGQDSIGLRPWAQFAREAGVPDVAAFETCLADSSSAEFEAQEKFAAKYAVYGTPTIIVDGWKLAQPPSADSLRRMARDLLAGRELFPDME